MAFVFEDEQPQQATGPSGRFVFEDEEPALPSYMRRGATAEMFGPGGPLGPEVVIPRLLEAIKQGALPTIGAVGGGIGGGLVSLPAGGSLAFPGAMAGSAGGEALNQYLGITEPSNLQLGIAAAAPGLPIVGRGLAAGTKGLARRGVGLFAPQVPREEILPGIARAIRAVPGRIRPPDKGFELFDPFREPNIPEIPLPQTLAFSTKLAGEAPIPATRTSVQTLAGQLDEAIRSPGGMAEVKAREVAALAGRASVTPEELAMIRAGKQGSTTGLSLGDIQAIMSRLDHFSAGSNTNLAGQASNIKRNIYADLKAVPPETKPIVDLLLKNRAIVREQKAADLLSRWLRPGGQVIKTTPDGTTVNMNLGRLRDLIDANKYFREGLTKNSRADLEATLNWAFRATKRLPKPEEGAIGRFVVSRAFGAGAGMLTGLPPSIGGTIGLIAVPPLIAQAVQTATGRALVRTLFRNEGLSSRNAGQAISVLSAFLASQAASPAGIGAPGELSIEPEEAR